VAVPLNAMRSIAMTKFPPQNIFFGNIIYFLNLAISVYNMKPTANSQQPIAGLTD
jgi:hypothetical protein